MERIILPYAINGRKVDISLVFTLEDGLRIPESIDKAIYINLIDYARALELVKDELISENKIMDRGFPYYHPGNNLETVNEELTDFKVIKAAYKKIFFHYDSYISKLDPLFDHEFKFNFLDLLKSGSNDVPFAQLYFLQGVNYLMHCLELDPDYDGEKLGHAFLNEELILLGYLKRLIMQEYVFVINRRAEELDSFKGDYPGEPIDDDFVDAEDRIFRAIRNGEGDNYGL